MSDTYALGQLAQHFGAVRIEHHPALPAQYQIAVKYDDEGSDDFGFSCVGTGASLEQAIEEARRLAPGLL